MLQPVSGLAFLASSSLKVVVVFTVVMVAFAGALLALAWGTYEAMAIAHLRRMTNENLALDHGCEGLLNTINGLQLKSPDGSPIYRGTYAADWSRDETDYLLLHQATRKLLELLRERRDESMAVISFPPFTSAASATATCIGVTARPWPKATVIVVTSDHFFGTIGLAISGRSVGTLSKNPNRFRYACCPS